MNLVRRYSSNNNNSVEPAITWTAQGIVWISLYFVQTTGAGLPSGPFGIVGGLEGISYLIVLVQAIRGGMANNNNDGSLAKQGAVGTIGLGLLVLASLVAQQGCIPNAKPLLDYSSYLPVCSPLADGSTPGLFGQS